MSLDWGNHQLSNKSGGRKDLMQRKVPQNSKYAHVKSQLETGSTVGKRQAVTSGMRAKRLNENFFRIGSIELFTLLEEYEKMDAEEEVRTHAYGNQDYNPKVVVIDAHETAEIERPYLILDVRDEEDFRTAHLMQALSFPQRLLMQDRSSKDLVRFRNQEGKLIVVYDDAPQNRLASAAAQILATRGFENIYVLSGGISDFFRRHKGTFVEGNMRSDQNSPSQHSHKDTANDDSRSTHSHARSHLSSNASNMRSVCQPSPGNSSSTNSARSRALDGGSSMQLARVGISGAGKRHGRGNGMRLEEEDELASRMSGASVADSVISRAMSRKMGGSGNYGGGVQHYR